MIRSVCHGLVKETVFVHVPYSSCGVHRRCAVGFVCSSFHIFVEGAISRASANRECTLTHQVTSPNPGLHALHQGVDLHNFLRQIHSLGGLADTAEEKAIYARVT